MKRFLNDLSIGARVSITVLTLIVFALGVITWVASEMATHALHDKSVQELGARTGVVVKMVEAYDSVLRESAVRVTSTFVGMYPGKVTIDSSRTVDVAGVQTPMLLVGDKALNLDFEVVDRLRKTTGAVATVFVRNGDDFVRVTTSVKKESGERAVGTLLGKDHPARASVLAGRSFVGRATLFGREYMAEYRPMLSDDGAVIGLWFAAIDFTEGLKALQEAILSEKIGETGYFYVIESRPGPSYGTFVVHPTRTGQNALDLVDATTGRPFLVDVVQQKKGALTYWLLDTTRGDRSARQKLAVFDEYPAWGWVVVGGSYSEELSRAAVTLRNATIALSLLTIALLGAAVFVTVRVLVRKPLEQAVTVTREVAAGRLTADVRIVRNDEIGQLMQSLRAMTEGLRDTVGAIRASAGTIGSASEQMSSRNEDLAKRTQAQAASLEETAATMEELTVTVRQSAESARDASDSAQGASTMAAEGGRAVELVVSTMGAIREGSRKIEDIVGVIDAIAFQTNILALNAAVEAARAGEQGRGFAVVATAVRELAQQAGAAAKEIRTLIGDSVEKVEAGAALATRAGETMTEVVASVTRVTKLFGEIAAASSQQSTAIEQVTLAVTQMDGVTQENASLVTDALATADELEQQARALAAAVAVFELPDADVHHRDHAVASQATPPRTAEDRNNARPAAA